MENKISVIVITYNQENTIARTLDSVLMQKCHLPIEIILGEDDSTDNTRKVCETYAELYPDIIRLMDKAPNKGFIDNYFDCLLACNGKYIADCAGDDFWIDDTKLEKEINLLERDHSITLVHTDWMYYNENTGDTIYPGRNPFSTTLTDGKTMLEGIVTQITRPIIHLCTAVYRADVIKKAYNEDTFLFRNKDFGCEDLQICFTAANSGKIAYLPDITLYYSRKEQSVSFTTDNRKQFMFVKKITDLSFYLCKKYKINTSATDKYFKNRLFALAMHAFRSEDASLRDKAWHCAAEWHVKMSWKALVVHGVMLNSLTWGIALYARRLFVAAKRLKKRLTL